MINLKQVEAMLQLQNTMNKTINNDWAGLDWDYFRASCLEGSEAVEHHGWKWWKKQQKDVPQLQMEIVDIWHFYLSRYLQLSQGDESEALSLFRKDYETLDKDLIVFDTVNYNLSALDTLQKLDLLIGLSAAKRLNLFLMLSLVESTGMSWAIFFEQYVQKNILNVFRQKNGYKEGTYHKEWFKQEDNVFLVLEAAKLNSSDDNYVELLWNALTQKYKEALEQK
jgi:hypothetical protein